MKTAKQTTHTALSKVCIMQKYNDSERVLECREEFNEAERLIINAVNSHTALVEALEMARDYINSIENFNDEAKETLDEIDEALKQAKGE